MCHVSWAMCHMLCFFFIYINNIYIQNKSILKQKFDKVVEKVGGGSVFNEAYPVYFFLPRLILGASALRKQGN